MLLMEQLKHRLAPNLFVVVLPFSFYPRVIDGDTQPWPFLATVLLFVLSSAIKGVTRADVLVVGVTLGCLVMYLLRTGIDEDFLRFAYKMMAFILLWLCVPALPPALIARAMRWVIAIWFFVGLLQTLAVAIGLDVSFSGRFVWGRSGVPSLTPEPSLYGTLSVVALLYLLMSKEGARPPFVFMGLGNVFLSGSILAIMASCFVVLLLDVRTRIFLFVTVFPAVALAVSSTNFMFLTRLNSVLGSSANSAGLLLDPSFNARVGHVVYTLWVALPSALIFQTAPDFERSYNTWAARSDLFGPTSSNFILTGMGDIIYRGGAFGLALLIIIYTTAFQTSRANRTLKLAIITCLMLSQVGISSAFFILFVQQREGD